MSTSARRAVGWNAARTASGSTPPVNPPLLKYPPATRTRPSARVTPLGLVLAVPRRPDFDHVSVAGSKMYVLENDCWPSFWPPVTSARPSASGTATYSERDLLRPSVGCQLFVAGSHSWAVVAGVSPGGAERIRTRPSPSWTPIGDPPIVEPPASTQCQFAGSPAPDDAGATDDDGTLPVVDGPAGDEAIGVDGDGDADAWQPPTTRTTDATIARERLIGTPPARAGSRLARPRTTRRWRRLR